MRKQIKIGNRIVGGNAPVYVIAEMSANHNQDFDQAVKIIEAAKEAGADAIKLQTYTPDTMTLDCNNEYFHIGKGTIWEGKYLYDLYQEAYTPWEWQPKLKEVANNLGMDLFSTPFDKTAVDFLQKMDVPVYKVSSFELVDFPLIQYIARTGKPIIMSTGMAALTEIGEVINIAYMEGCYELAILKCTSSYPTDPKDMNLSAISFMKEAFLVPVGLSDHSLDVEIPGIAVATGACIIEKHLTLSRSITGPDSSFSLEPDEFKKMVSNIRKVEEVLGEADCLLTKKEEDNKVFRRSIFVVEDMEEGEVFTEKNIRCIRPGKGLHTRYYNDIIGRKVCTKVRIKRGTPLDLTMF
jgi:pseudaminic acid synthase